MSKIYELHRYLVRMWKTYKSIGIISIVLFKPLVHEIVYNVLKAEGLDLQFKNLLKILNFS